MMIHIFTGSKGGIGKTRCTISAGLYYLIGEKQRDINLFDGNMNNIDFFYIMTGIDYLRMNPTKITTTNTIKINEVDKTETSIYYSQSLICRDKRKANGTAYIREWPYELYNNINDFWRNIYNIVKHTTETNKNKVLFVDSNLTLGSLLSTNGNLWDETKTIFAELKK